MDIQWPLVLFTLLSGTGASIALFLGIQILMEKSSRLVRPCSITALVFLIAGGLCSAAHLAHPLRAFTVVAHPGEGIFLEACLLALVALLLIGILATARPGKERVLKGLSAAVIVASAALSFFSGASYMMAAHPAWNSVLLPLCYLITSLTAGGACFGLIAALKGGHPIPLALSVLEGFLGIAAIAIIGAYGAVADIFSSNYAVFAWGGLLLSGVLPAAVGFICAHKPRPTLFAVAAVSALAGGILIRMSMWLTMDLGLAAISVSLM